MVVEMRDRQLFPEGPVQCITMHPAFGDICLNAWVLRVAYYQYRQEYGELNKPINK